MARLYGADEIRRLAQEGSRTLTLGAGEIISPLALDVAKELGVEVVRGGVATRERRPAGGDMLEDRVRAELRGSLAELGDADVDAVVRRTIERVGRWQRSAHAPLHAAPPAGTFGSLEGRVAVVTGAASGIGRAAAIAIAEAGARVVLGSVEGEPEPVAETLSAIEAGGGEALVVRADVRSMRDADGLSRAAIDRWGRLDVVVANAGVLRRDALADLTDERWQSVLDVDLTGVLRTVRGAAPSLGSGASVICVSSIAGAVYGWAEHAHYAAAKAGVVGLVRSLAVELGPRGVRVNALAPGLVESPQSTDERNSLGVQGLRRAAAAVPLGRIGTAREVADVVRFLASDAAAYVTGQVVVVDGGLTADMNLA